MNVKPTIGVIGLGRMGQAVLGQLQQRQDVLFFPISRLNEGTFSVLKTCDVVIEFTLAEVAPGVIRECILNDIPTVSGTTGWHENELEAIHDLCTKRAGKFLSASNFSIGMNIVFALNEKLALVLAGYPEFKPSVKEIHHIHKKDMPSGTAISLLKGIMKEQPQFVDFNLNNAKSTDSSLIDVEALREGEVKGIHEVIWNSGMEKITLGHEAMDRGIFAAGAIVAALWLLDQSPGVYTMRDIIHF